MSTRSTRSSRKRPVAPRPTPVTVAVPRTAQAPTSFRLLDLADELLAKVLASSTDCVGLVRMSQACKALLRAARNDRLWQPILLGFFDGTLPPDGIMSNSQSSSSAATQADPQSPLEALRQQVSFARRLCDREVGLKLFVIPEYACLTRYHSAWRLEDSGTTIAAEDSDKG